MNNITKKAGFIKQLDSLSAAEKENAIAFFTKHLVYENRIDWNNKLLQYHDFEKVFKAADASHKSIKRMAKTNPEVMFEKYNCRIVSQTEDFLVVIPLDWECMVFFNSFECGGTGAKWCIGEKNNCNHWNLYISAKNIFYLIYFVKKHPVYGRKILIQYNKETDKFTTWNVRDSDLPEETVNNNYFLYVLLNPIVNDVKSCKGEKMKEIFSMFPDLLLLEICNNLIPLVNREKGADLLERIQGVRRQTALDLGLVIPSVRIINNLVLDPSEYCFKIKGVDAGRGKIRMGYFLCINPGTVTVEIEGEKTVEPAFGLPAIWLSEEKRDEAERSGYSVVDPVSIIATHLFEIIRRHAADILNLQNTQDILDTLRIHYPAVVDEVLKGDGGLRVVEIQKILQGLLKEQVSIRDMVSILESIAYYATVSRDIRFLTEKARQALASQICLQYADEEKVLRVLTLDPTLEQKLIDSKHESSGIISALDPPAHKMWIKAVSEAAAKVKEKSGIPVILCSEQARFLVKNSTERELPELVVLSIPEIAGGFTVEAVGTIRINEDNPI